MMIRSHVKFPARVMMALLLAVPSYSSSFVVFGNLFLPGVMD